MKRIIMHLCCALASLYRPIGNFLGYNPHSGLSDRGSSPLASPPCRKGILQNRPFLTRADEQKFHVLHNDCSFLFLGYRNAKALTAKSGRSETFSRMCARAAHLTSQAWPLGRFLRIRNSLYPQRKVGSQSHPLFFRSRNGTLRASVFRSGTRQKPRLTLKIVARYAGCILV